MSFNFNWSPLIADTSRAKEMLTAALNKSPKPPIIVDDIIVSELNLGATPPDLEILEIGDLAEDRFRGIFKMSYTGDAFLTLKTRVQANPLNTYLSTKPTFASPQPLAAASGLTIPLAITLSDIRLSGFVILVFSKHKGMTLVFRNDPLESLKVSSTFDSIPFVRDYLQREIEKQLRNLFMEDLPAILHKLSLRLWSPEYRELDDRLLEAGEDTTIPVDPLASPPQDPADWSSIGNGESVPSFSLDSSESHASFSQKNLLRLAALSDSHRTLSLFTPPIRDAVFRAWAGASERGSSGLQTPMHATIPALSRVGSYVGSAASTSSVLSDSASEYSRTSTSYTFQGTTSRYGHRPRKAKKRVINLRRTNTDTSAPTLDPITASTTPEPSIAPSSAPSVIYEEQQEDQLTTPPRTPVHPTIRRHRSSSLDTPDATPRASMLLPKEKVVERGPPAYALLKLDSPPQKKKEKARRPPLKTNQTVPAMPASSSAGDIPSLLRTLSSEKMVFGNQMPNLAAPFSPAESSTSSSGGILEQAWLMKMARDINKKVEEERRRGGVKRKGSEDIGSFFGEDGILPPPAYAA